MLSIAGLSGHAPAHAVTGIASAGATCSGHTQPSCRMGVGTSNDKRFVEQGDVTSTAYTHELTSGRLLPVDYIESPASNVAKAPVGPRRNSALTRMPS